MRFQKTFFDKDLKNIFYSRLIYVSSVVEGINLKKSEVTQIVKDGKKGLKVQSDSEYFKQALGQKIVLNLIEKWAKFKQPLDISYIQEIHRIVFGSIDPGAGEYREVYVKLRSSKLQPSFPFIISADMSDFNRWLVDYQKQITGASIREIIFLVSKSYHEITRIHPFSDGNGRTARLFVNLLLRKYGLPYIIIPKVDNFQQMRQALRTADEGNLDPLCGYIKEFLQESQNEVRKYWQDKLKSG